MTKQLILLALLGIPAVANALGERNPVTPPALWNFDDKWPGVTTAIQDYDAAFASNFTVVDADGEGRSWGMYKYYAPDEGYTFAAYLKYPISVAKADDWLITRAISLEAGKYYHISLEPSLFSGSGKHVLEVCMGQYNDAAGMENQVIAPFEVTTKRHIYADGWFRPEDDGIYYIGVHAISPSADATDWMFVDDITIDEARTGAEPSVVQNLEFVNDPDATSAVYLNFNLPTTTVDGSNLSGELSVAISRDGTLVGTVSGKQPGEYVSFKDAAATTGDHKFSLTVTGASGTGAEVRTFHYCGVTNPVMPVISSFTELEKGIVKATWEAPTTDLNGVKLNPDKFTYNVYAYENGGASLLAQSISEREFVHDLALDEGDQQLVLLLVEAEINGMLSDRVATPNLFTGDPYPLPFIYSFKENGTAIAASGDAGVEWRYLDDFSDPDSQDGDNGYISMIGSEPDQTGTLSTGMIDLRDAENPALSVWTYTYVGDQNTVAVKVRDHDTDEVIQLAKYTLNKFARAGWNQLNVPLDKVKGRVVEIQLECTIQTHGYIPFDNLKVEELATVDLAVTGISAPRYAGPGEDVDVVATVRNGGHKEVKSFAARLYANGQLVAEKQGGAVEPNATTEVLLTTQFSAVSPEVSTLRVEVEAAGDADDTNNASEEVNVAFLAPIHPAVSDLTARENGTEVLLTWSAPDLTKAAPTSQTEGFEEYEAYSTELDGWTMHDGDGGYILGFSNLELPLKDTQQAWFTLTNEGLYAFTNPYEGRCILAQMASVDSKGKRIDSDDWLISPELYGGRQNISFQAKSISIDYGYERFEVLASSTDNRPESFSVVLPETEVGEEWEQIMVSLPLGSKYFAIRCTSPSLYMLFLDAIEYIPAGTPRSYQLLGYNVYRNGVKQNSELVVTPLYATAREMEGDDYFVTAVYDLGESAASNVAHLGEDSIEEVSAPTETVWYDLLGRRVLLPKKGLYLRNGQKVLVK